MRIIVLLILSVASATAKKSFTDNQDKEWTHYKKLLNKKYKSKATDNLRQAIYFETKKKNLANNNRHSKGKSSFACAKNQFSDMLVSEFLEYIGGEEPMKIPETRWQRTALPDEGPLPKKIDWRKRDAVTAVGNQRKCGASWAFAAAGALEGRHKIATGEYVELSVQNLLDCVYSTSQNGCKGGNVTDAFDYVIKNRGIESDVSYSYQAKRDKCKFNGTATGAAFLTKYYRIKPGDEGELQKAVALGPVAAAIDGSNWWFRSYSYGILDVKKCKKQNLTHNVLIVGYGTSKRGQDYWIIKNSWSNMWGMNGYGKIARNRGNMCGIASNAYWPSKYT